MENRGIYSCGEWRAGKKERRRAATSPNHLNPNYKNSLLSGYTNHVTVFTMRPAYVTGQILNKKYTNTCYGRYFIVMPR